MKLLQHQFRHPYTTKDCFADARGFLCLNGVLAVCFFITFFNQIKFSTFKYSYLKLILIFLDTGPQPGLLPNHKQSVLLFLDRVYGIDSQACDRD